MFCSNIYIYIYHYTVLCSNIYITIQCSVVIYIIIYITIQCSVVILYYAVCNNTTQYTVVPTRRATAEAIQILTQHLLGDAFSPLIVGAVSTGTEGGGGRE